MPIEYIRDSVSTSSKLYRPTDKEPDSSSMGTGTQMLSGDKEFVYWTLAQRIRDYFGDEGATINDISIHVTGPMGLSVRDTIDIVYAAKKAGFLK